MADNFNILDQPLGDNLGDHIATQNLDLATFKLVGNEGSTGINIAVDGKSSTDNDLTIMGTHPSLILDATQGFGRDGFIHNTGGELQINWQNWVGITVGQDSPSIGVLNVDVDSDWASVNGTFKVSEDIELGSASDFYLGDPNTDGTWRYSRVGNNVEWQRREVGVYVTKQQITP